MKTSELLQRAQDRIRDPEHWCAEVFYQTKDGYGEHIRWCAVGALREESESCADALSRDKATSALRITAYHLFNMGVFDVNDKRGHSAVMRVYDRAIQLAKESENESIPV
jgi:hypothetical protein